VPLPQLIKAIGDQSRTKIERLLTQKGCSVSTALEWRVHKACRGGEVEQDVPATAMPPQPAKAAQTILPPLPEEEHDGLGATATPTAATTGMEQEPAARANTPLAPATPPRAPTPPPPPHTVLPPRYVVVCMARI
jgi:hypothetical protein